MSGKQLNKTRILIIFVGGTIISTQRKGYIDSIAELFKYMPVLNKYNSQVEFGECKPFDDYINYSDTSINQMLKIAIEIEKTYDNYDGFLILHDTDTMAYTASYLSFVCENLCKPIVLTGSQLPLSNPRTDAISNFLNSLEIVAYKKFDLPRVPEVLICFADKVLRGNRTTKTNSSQWTGFDSPNIKPIGTIQEQIILDKNNIKLGPSKKRRFSINRQFSDRILVFDTLPGVDIDRYKKMILKEDIDGVIIQTYGANILNNEKFSSLIKKAAKKGKIIVLKPQAPEGIIHFRRHQLKENISNLYVNGMDITTEAACAKLSIILGLGLSPEKTRELFEFNLRGEQYTNKGFLENLFNAPDPNHSIQLVKNFNAELINYLAKNPTKISDLNPRSFEILIAEIFKYNGYHVELTPRTRDGGYDFSAFKVDDHGKPNLMLVEVKKYKSSHSVGVGIIRGLFGVVSQQNAERGLVVTSSKFTKDAYNFQKPIEHRLSLKDYSDLKKWLNEFT